MKKYRLILGIVVCSTFAAYAQSPTPLTLKISPSAQVPIGPLQDDGSQY